MAFKTLEDTFIYNHLNKSNGISNNIATSLNRGIVLGIENLEEEFMVINKNFKYPLKLKVVDAVKRGDILLVYSPEKITIPKFLPFILSRNNNGNVVGIVFVDVWSEKMDANGNVKIDPKKLYCMMEAAYLARVCYLNSKELVGKTAIISNGSAIYSMMFTKVLNKKFALNIDKNKYHKVLFLSSKFYMLNIMGMKDSDLVFNYAIKNCPNGNMFSLKEIDELVPESAYANLESFIKALSKAETGLNMKDLTVRNYIEAFINMYDSSSLLSLESFPYFVYNVNAVVNGAYINNQYVMEDIVYKYGPKLYTALMSLTD